jgi:1,4-dihydroxy-2-naphthoyl-CoA synthase
MLDYRENLKRPTADKPLRKGANMDDGNLLVTRHPDYVAVITLNRPAQLNAFTVELATDLDQTLREWLF